MSERHPQMIVVARDEDGVTFECVACDALARVDRSGVTFIRDGDPIAHHGSTTPGLSLGVRARPA